MTPNIIDVREYRDRKFLFRDRLHAGELLAIQLSKLNLKKPQLLAIPSGGVPVGDAMAKKLRIPLDIVVVRKIQIPWNTEAGFGAIAWDGTMILNEPLVSMLKLPEQIVQQCVSQTKEVIRERQKKFRGDRPMHDLKDKQVILVDDGLASGFTMAVAVQSAKKMSPDKIIVAVPTASERAIEFVASSVDTLLCLNIRSGPVFAVADAYQKWYDLSDEEVVNYLKEVEP